MRTEELFDRVAARYDEAVPFFTTFGARLVDWAGVAAGDRVLDVGAGAGAVSLAALERVGPGGSVLAVDSSAAMVDRLDRVGAEGLTTRVMDAHRLDCPDETFDVVLCGFVLHILDDPERALAEARRVLRPDGVLAFSVPGPSEDGAWWDRYGEIVAEFQELLPERPAGLTEPGFPDLERLGFDRIEPRDEEVHLPLAGPDAYWDWLMSHGNRWLYDALEPADARRFRERVERALVECHPTGGRTLDAGATFYRMRRAPGFR